MKKGHELKIRERLSKSYLQVIFIASISAIVGIIALLVMTKMYNNALNNYGFSQGDIGKAMTAFSGARSEVRAAVGYMDEDIISEAKDTYYTRKDSFQQYLDDIESSMVTQAGKDAYNQIVKDLDGYWDLSDQLIEEGSTTDQEISKKVQRREADELGPAYQVVYNDLKNLMNIYVQKGDQIESVLAVMEIIAVIIMIAVIILSILSGRRYGNQIADGISKPLQQISERLKTFAEGDLDSEFPEHDAKDEVAEMIETARKMADNLNVIISDSGKLLNEMADGNFAVATEHEERLYANQSRDSRGLRHVAEGGGAQRRIERVEQRLRKVGQDDFRLAKLRFGHHCSPSGHGKDGFRALHGQEDGGGHEDSGSHVLVGNEQRAVGQPYDCQRVRDSGREIEKRTVGALRMVAVG